MNLKTKDNPKGAGMVARCDCGNCKNCRVREYQRKKQREYDKRKRLSSPKKTGKPKKVSCWQDFDI